MAMAHVCTGCGRDLARVRAAIEPIYRLPLVQCPGCGLPCVRRRHPLVAGWRRFRRIDRAVFILVGKLLLLSGFGVVTAVTASVFVAEPITLDDVMTDGGYRALAVWMFLGLPILLGMFVGSALGHWRWGANLLCAYLLVLTAGWLGPALIEFLYNEARGRPRHRLMFEDAAWRRTLLVMSIIWLLALPWLLLAGIITRAHERGRSWRWRRRLARRRRERQGAA